MIEAMQLALTVYSNAKISKLRNWIDIINCLLNVLYLVLKMITMCSIRDETRQAVFGVGMLSTLLIGAAINCLLLIIPLVHLLKGAIRLLLKRNKAQHKALLKASSQTRSEATHLNPSKKTIRLKFLGDKKIISVQRKPLAKKVRFYIGDLLKMNRDQESRLAQNHPQTEDHTDKDQLAIAHSPLVAISKRSLHPRLKLSKPVRSSRSPSSTRKKPYNLALQFESSLSSPSEN